MRLKKIVLAVVLILASAYIIELGKNLFMYLFFYEHGVTIAQKLNGRSNEVMGTWEYTFDTIQCGMDERHEFGFVIMNDSTGTFSYNHYSTMFNSNYCHPYSWGSLLGSRIKSEKMSKSGRLVLTPNEIKLYSNDDSIKLFYKYSKDSLYISTGLKHNGQPVWGDVFSVKAKMIDLLPML